MLKFKQQLVAVQTTLLVWNQLDESNRLLGEHVQISLRRMCLVCQTVAFGLVCLFALCFYF